MQKLIFQAKVLSYGYLKNQMCLQKLLKIGRLLFSINSCLSNRELQFQKVRIDRFYKNKCNLSVLTDFLKCNFDVSNKHEIRMLAEI